ncbi:MAG: tetratricopeptide repeat protein [Actinomycetota bacterium]|nr:tetratricopeptide repeat protein [Actinomycetota bacterium]
MRKRVDYSSLPVRVMRELDYTALADRAEEAKESMATALAAFDVGNTGKALAAARKAKDAAPRARSVRETLGLILHARGAYKEALSELQTYKRMSGSSLQDPIIGDCYRALGRPDKALEIVQALGRFDVDQSTWVDAQITRARAHEDRGNIESALGVLNIADDLPDLPEDLRLRLRYELAEMLERGDRKDEARAMFARIAVKSPGYRDVVDRARALAP